MFIYFIVILICYVPEFITEFKSIKGKIIIISLVSIFLCFGYMVGSDWRAYEEMYYNLDLKNIYYNIPCEYGYYFYMIFFRILKFDFWTFFIFTKLITYLICTYTIIKFSKENFYFSFTLFVFFYGLSFFIDNPMRNLIAVTIFTFSYRYIEKRSLLKYILVVILASLFHIISLVMIPLYWVTKSSIKTTMIVIIYIVVNIFLWTFDRQLKEIFTIATGIPYVDAKLSFYFTAGSSGNIYTENRIFSIGLLVRYVLFALILNSREKIEQKFGKDFFNIVVISFFLYRLGIGIPIFERLEYYLCIPFCIAIIDLTNYFTSLSKPLYKLSLLILISFSTLKNITLDYKYIPYSNYIYYMFDNQKPSFEERSNYNYKNSPYKNR